MPPLSATSSATPSVTTATPFSRRDALKVFAAQMALSLAACAKPAEEIVPYVRMPEGMVPGVPRRFATSLEIGGWGIGVLAISVDGRPIKIEGNPAHPASEGATNPLLEAAVLSLYDPDRSQNSTHFGEPTSAAALRQALEARSLAARNNRGRGLHLLTPPLSSPTALRQIGEILDAMPQAHWYTHAAFDERERREGARLAFGEDVIVLPRLDAAKVVVALDADPLGIGPDQIRNARGWSRRRDTGNPTDYSRVHVAESASTLTGMKADRRLAARPDAIGNIAIALARALGADLAAPDLPENAAAFVRGAAADLQRHAGAAVVLAGDNQPAEIHALVHWINAAVKAPQRTAARDAVAGKAGPLEDLVHAIDRGEVDTLLVLDCNPAYDAAAGFAMAAALPKAGFSLHLGSYVDETAALCHWHVPLHHPLESWSDLRSRDGTASIVQPLIRPLYQSWSMHEILGLIGGRHGTAYDLVRQTWQSHRGGDFDAWWRRALHDGVAEQPASPDLKAPTLPTIAPRPMAAGLTLAIAPDPCLRDGRLANSPWLQECPKPIGKQVWGNALAIAPRDAARYDLVDGDVVRLSFAGNSLETPVRVDPGAAAGVMTMTAGYGRSRAGAIGNGIGTNAFTLQPAAGQLLLRDVMLTPAGRNVPLLQPLHEVPIDRDTAELYPMQSLGKAAAAPVEQPQPHPSLLPEQPPDGLAWGMVIDTSLCIGCNACVVACQAENNVPVVGPEEIARGRAMHWLRVDAYRSEDNGEVRRGFQPVPCMHCEHAPCEPVCPVAASVHDGEGLNVQVYNRCIGTRFCEANCPYKVRRFNFFGYADGQEYANLGLDPLRAQRNPDVSVRQRGVMEKCTYCVQRISRAHHEANVGHTPLGPESVTTACQAACPTSAIAFGAINHPDTEVSRRRTHPHHYELLGHLGTRPRTTYLADLRNPPAEDERRADGGAE